MLQREFEHIALQQKRNKICLWKTGICFLPDISDGHAAVLKSREHDTLVKILHTLIKNRFLKRRVAGAVMCVDKKECKD